MLMTWASRRPGKISGFHRVFLTSHESPAFVMQGPLAQLVERHVYTVDVIGSSPVGPTRRCCSIPQRSLGRELTRLDLSHPRVRAPQQWANDATLLARKPHGRGCWCVRSLTTI